MSESGILVNSRFTCALGAQQTVLAIPYALPIAHSGPGCVTKMFMFTSVGAGQQGEGYAGGGTITCTNMTEQDVVFGGEEKLKGFISGAIKVLKGDLYVVLTGCTAGIIGDDVEQVAHEFANRGYPVVGVDTAGFRGNSYVGHGLVVNAIIQQYVDRDAPKPNVRKGLVNVFASVPPQNPFWRGDLEEIKKLLALAGLEANVLFGSASAGVSEWKDIPNAEFNIVMSAWVGLDTAKLLEEMYGTPYIHIPSIPVGADASARVLRQIAAFAGLDKEQLERGIAKEEKRFNYYFASLADFFADMRNMIPSELYIVADATYAIGAGEFLVNELGLELEGIYITDDPPERAKKSILEAFGALGDDFHNKVFFNPDGSEIHEDIRQKLGKSKNAAIFGSAFEDTLAKETGNLSYHISMPMNNDVVTTRTFAGFNGGLRLIEELYAGIFRSRQVAGTTASQYAGTPGVQSGNA